MASLATHIDKTPVICYTPRTESTSLIFVMADSNLAAQCTFPNKLPTFLAFGILPTSIRPCKGKNQYLLTLQVGRYWLLLLQSSVTHNTQQTREVDPMYLHYWASVADGGQKSFRIALNM